MIFLSKWISKKVPDSIFSWIYSKEFFFLEHFHKLRWNVWVYDKIRITVYYPCYPHLPHPNILDQCMFGFIHIQTFFLPDSVYRSMKENISKCSPGLIQCFKEGAVYTLKYRDDSKKSCKWWAEKKEAFSSAEITFHCSYTKKLCCIVWSSISWCLSNN